MCSLIKALREKYREFIHVNMVDLIHDRTGDVKGFKQSWGWLTFPYPKIKTQFRIPLAYHEWRFFWYFHLEFSFWMSEQFYSLRHRWCKLQQHIARNKGALKMMEVGTWPRIRNFGCLRGYASNVSGPSSPNTWMNLVEVMSIFKTGNFLVADFVWVTWKPTTSLSTISFWSSFFFFKRVIL